MDGRLSPHKAPGIWRSLVSTQRVTDLRRRVLSCPECSQSRREGISIGWAFVEHGHKERPGQHQERTYVGHCEALRFERTTQ